VRSPPVAITQQEIPPRELRWTKVFRSLTIAKILAIFSAHEDHHAYTLHALEEQIPRSRVALRHGLRTLMEAELIREERHGATCIYVSAEPDLLRPLREFIERAEVRESEARASTSRMSWARKFLSEPGPRRQSSPPGPRILEQVADLGGEECRGDDVVLVSPLRRDSPAAVGRRDREGRA